MLKLTEIAQKETFVESVCLFETKRSSRVFNMPHKKSPKVRPSDPEIAAYMPTLACETMNCFKAKEDIVTC